MSRKLVISPEAGADIRAAFRWYESQRRGLGQPFKLAVQAALSQAQRNPDRFRIASDDFRRVLVQHFPFEAFFDFDEEKVVVYFVFHTSQDPEKWRDRLRQQRGS